MRGSGSLGPQSFGLALLLVVMALSQRSYLALFKKFAAKALT